MIVMQQIKHIRLGGAGADTNLSAEEVQEIRDGHHTQAIMITPNFDRVTRTEHQRRFATEADVGYSNSNRMWLGTRFENEAALAALRDRTAGLSLRPHERQPPQLQAVSALNDITRKQASLYVEAEGLGTLVEPGPDLKADLDNREPQFNRIIGDSVLYTAHTVREPSQTAALELYCIAYLIPKMNHQADALGLKLTHGQAPDQYVWGQPSYFKHPLYA